MRSSTLLLQGLFVAVVAAVWGGWAFWTLNYGPKHGLDSQTGTRGPVISADELAQHTSSRSCWLAILGHVFDVTQGARLYGPDGGYHFFAGRDASRAFVTGEFKGDGLTADMAGLSPREALEVHSWLTFYQDSDEYHYLGVLEGEFFDAQGRETDAWRAAQVLVAKGEADKAALKAEKAKYPSCNSRWKQGEGGNVWCKDEERVPRRVNNRCACYPKNEAARLGKETLYENCAPEANRCRMPSPK